MIVAKPTSGLCNRMRVIDSCISVLNNNKEQHSIQLIWELNAELNCPFARLFEPIENINLVKANTALNYFQFYKNKSSLKTRSKIKGKFFALLFRNYRYFDDRNIQSVAYNHEYWNNSDYDFVIHSCIDFYSPELRNPGKFVPVPKLQQLIDKEVGKFTHPTTGIHIRRTDSIKSINKSSTELFLKEISESLKKTEDQLFFLATDDKKEEELLIAEFGDRIIIQENKDLNRNSVKGIEDALVDLYTLSNTRVVWGSYWSSFSKTAAGLKGIPLKIVGQDS